ncbi:MAG: hypothetical protein QOE33_3476 [Acidobacteriota bacterium]|nr:hypothetical protein [Acidobacteriota bacterium]
MLRLPVSGLEVLLRAPGGAEDVLLLDAFEYDARLALALLSRVAHRADGGDVDCETLTVTDFDALLLQLRRLVFGDLIRADMKCPAADCGAQIDVAFSVRDYLSHHEPRIAHRAEPTGEDGWFRLRGTDFSFRLPTVADLLAVSDHPHAERELRRRCLRPAKNYARFMPRIETAMRALAPSLSDVVRGTCPECGEGVDIHFDPRQFVLRELRGQAAYVYADVHLIAGRYHWSEADILALPRARRLNYAEMIRRELSLD